MKAEPFLVGLRLDQKPCVVVGSSDETAMRVEALARAGARVRVISPQPDATLTGMNAAGRIELEQRDFEEDDLDGAWLAVLTDMDAVLAKRMAENAAARRVWFCAIDQPRFASFFHVAIARSGSLAVAISTSGKAPALARRLKEELERLFSAAHIGDLVDRLAEIRAQTPRLERRDVLTTIVSRVTFRGNLELPDP